MGKAFESIKAELVEAMEKADREGGREALLSVPRKVAEAQGKARLFEDSRDHAVQPVKPVAPRRVACPKCGVDVEWITENRYRPFCSARCKGMDFVAWATDSYRVEASEEPHPEDQSE